MSMPSPTPTFIDCINIWRSGEPWQLRGEGRIAPSRPGFLTADRHATLAMTNGRLCEERSGVAICLSFFKRRPGGQMPLMVPGGQATDSGDHERSRNGLPLVAARAWHAKPLQPILPHAKSPRRQWLPLGCKNSG